METEVSLLFVTHRYYSTGCKPDESIPITDTCQKQETVVTKLLRRL